MARRPNVKSPLNFRLLYRVFGTLAIAGCLTVLIASVPESPAQKPAGPSAEQPRPAPKQRVEEDVGPAKKPVRVDDGTLATTGVALFLREAKQAKHPAVIALYTRLAVPHDEVRTSGSEPIWVEPLRRYVGPGKTVA